MSSEQRGTNVVEDAVEQLGFGKQQIMVLIGGGCAHATNTAMAISTSQAARAIVAQAHFSKLFTGLLTSVLFFGYILGNSVSGPLADGFGRRPALIIAYAGLTACQTLSAALGSSSIMVMAACFTSCGFFMGIGLSGANAAIKEWAPARFRPTLFAWLFVFPACGQMGPGMFFSITSPGLSAESLQWRLLFSLQAAISCTLLIFCVLFLPESAQWLLHKGQRQKAEENLLSAAARNGCILDKSKFETVASIDDAQETGEATALKPGVAMSQSIFSGGLGQTTLIMCLLNVCANTCYYGLMCTLPGTLSASLEGTGIAAANVVVLLSMTEIPGIAIQEGLGRRLPRTTNLSAVFLTVSASLALLTASLTLQPSAVLLGSICCKLTIIASFVITYLSMAEAYPIACRGSGNGFCMTVGRLGALVAPVLYANLGDFAFYSMLSVLAFFSAVAGHMLKIQDAA
eukprot:TRINITY_DN60054_c0_g1_i1.p1 TRINITY_DN60054_c0_g1~~TRINITY_DN60054_c0_g1_i1.p1  ORF type:complete len:459 (+),score=82.83 TRINITY_DN60054_c0_g1_i1:53-1429(+)